MKCWSRAPTKRPPTAEVPDAFYGFLSLPQATRPPDGRPPTEDLPGRLKLKVQGIRISLNKPKHQEFSVKFKYGNGGHTTSWTKPVAGDEYPWFVLRPSLPLLSSLSFKQGQSGVLVDRSQQAVSWTVGLL